jgi:hypothetical protein
MIQALGKVTVPAAGTPVRSTANLTDPTRRYAVHGVLIQALTGNTGKVYIGTTGLNKSTLANVFAVLAIPTTNQLPTFSAALTLAPNAITLDDLYLDADINGEGVLVTALVN